MDFRRSGPLDERRRRVLMDEIASPADADNPDANSTASKGPVRAYHEAVLSQRQPKVTDLLPVRPLWILALLLLGLGGIAAIEAIHVQVATLKLSDGLAHLAALDSRQRGSLDNWYASALLAAAAALAVVIFGIRSHRVDDYRGHYRIWLWTAAALVWLSLDAATGIHDALGLVLTLITGKQVVTSSLAAGCTLTWIAVYALIFGTLGLRLAVEVWSSRLGSLALFIASALYITAALLQLQLIAVRANLAAGLAESTVILLAHFSLLAAVGFYARHVVLDAGGRLKVHIDPDRKNKSKRARLRVVKNDKPAQAAAPSKTLHNNQTTLASSAGAGTSTRPAVSITKSTVTSPPPSDEDDDESDDDAYAGLSRSERRRLKKLARREQRRAA